ncbi:hypothetical protein ASF60_22325 [Methylobacterium sp. Leaf113]|uniref:hypothetical protein n=1 Tax=Methylobacterium sp. Leaf113 TaxID=1736259 RepID=UPI0006F815D9|nr:hypothetical protein [Methylobacterium sp. Leaf113]KQP81109.1 hypothetical protein ASF60_22325 [Methylobacterium sp. Leaf113]
MIIETLANQFFRVRETGDPSAAHVWLGIEVKRVRGAYVPKAKAREILVRKLGTRMVEAA